MQLPTNTCTNNLITINISICPIYHTTSPIIKLINNEGIIITISIRTISRTRITAITRTTATITTISIRTINRTGISTTAIISLSTETAAMYSQIHSQTALLPILRHSLRLHVLQLRHHSSNRLSASVRELQIREHRLCVVRK